MQGNKRDSIADPDNFYRISRKLESFGGLYVYRDGIRILPYGNSDVDWLDIELRRNKGLGHYFFSYRRIYGAICLTRAENFALKEKAGREGFQKDKVYRQLKAILENLFMQLAADFYRKDADYGEHFQEKNSELKRLDAAKKKRDKQVGTKKKKLQKKLDSFFQKTFQQLPEGKVETLRLKVMSKMHVASTVSNPDEAAEKLLEAENYAREELSSIRQDYEIARPRGVSLSKNLEEDWVAFKNEQERLENEVFTPFARGISEELGVIAKEARVYIDQRRRLTDLIKQAANNRSATVKAEARLLEESASKTRRIAIDTARQAIQEFSSTVKNVEIDFAKQDLTDIDSKRAEELREMYESQIQQVGSKNTESLGRIREMLTSISENLENNADVEHLDLVEAMDSELQDLRQQADSDQGNWI